MSQPRDYSKELANLLDALAESAIEMPDEEILAEAADDGDDVAQAAEEVRDVLKGALKNHRQRKLIEAQRQYEEKMAVMFEQEYCLPESVEERRALLLGFLNNNPQVGNALLTTQHRKFEELSDEDIESYLKQLFELGALKSAREQEKSDE